MDYQQKYLKYKTKYLELKAQLGGNTTQPENQPTQPVDQNNQPVELPVWLTDGNITIDSKVSEFLRQVFGFQGCTQAYNDAEVICISKQPDEWCQWLADPNSQTLFDNAISGININLMDLKNKYCGKANTFTKGQRIPDDLQLAYAVYVVKHKGGNALAGHHFAECPFGVENDENRTKYQDTYLANVAVDGKEIGIDGVPCLNKEVSFPGGPTVVKPSIGNYRTPDRCKDEVNKRRESKESKESQN